MDRTHDNCRNSRRKIDREGKKSVLEKDEPSVIEQLVKLTAEIAKSVTKTYYDSCELVFMMNINLK